MLGVKNPEQAIKILKDECRMELACERVCLKDALGRILAQDIKAEEFVPGFDRSTVDGYAVIASDTFGCSQSSPSMLKMTGDVIMGQESEARIFRGSCMYVPTGGMLPQGADCVVMIEYVSDMGDGYMCVEKPAAPGQNVIFRGDDTTPEDTVLRRGIALSPADIGVLAAVGCAEVPVTRRPRLGIVSTGDEIISVENTPKGSQVRDVNSWVISAAATEFGCEPLMLGIIRDDFESLKGCAERALEECDMLVISGGSSVGARDMTVRVIESMSGAHMLFHGIAVKPGKPTIAALVRGKPVIGLPGHPVSAYFIFRIFVRSAIEASLGIEYSRRRALATLSQTLPSNHGREEYVPVKITWTGCGYEAVPVTGKSGLITQLSGADGYIKIERDCEGVSRGAQVEAFWL